MASQQRNRQKPPVRTVRGRGSKNQSSKRGLVLVFFLLISLTTLIVASIYAFKDEKDGKLAQTINDKIETVKKKDEDKPAVEKKVEKRAEKRAVKEKIEVTKNEPAKADGGGGYRKEEDIVGLIRLILYDYEVSRAAVKEKIVNEKGRQNVFFTITLADDMLGKVRTTLNSILSKKGYKTKINKRAILAINDKGSVEIEFVIPEVTTTKQNEKIYDKNDDKQPDKKQDKPSNKKQTSVADSKIGKRSVDEQKQPDESRPTPPLKSPIVVKMGILLDDGGANYTLAERFVKMRYPVAIAILPHLQYSKEVARLAASYKKTIFLHFPMEPKSYPSADPGEGAALVNMPEMLINSVVKYNINALGVQVAGVNNHMGSAFTEDRTKMNQVLSALKEYNTIFIDSRTSSSSVAYDECMKMGLRCGVNNKFIDNHNNVNYILERIYEAAEIAKVDGNVLIIGHVRAKTLDALEIALPILQERNIMITPIEQLIR